MTTRKTEQQFSTLLQKVTPDPYDNLKERCMFEDTPASLLAESSQITASQRFHPHRRWMVFAAGIPAVAAVFCLWLIGAVFYLPDSIVTVDVNPSISLELNSRNKVLSVTALNEDGKTILEGMDLKGTDVTVAVNALIGAMLQKGYLNDMENSVLLGISGRDEQISEKLRTKLMRSTWHAFSDNSLDGSVLSTLIDAADSDVQEIQEKYGISQGKATLAVELASQTSSLTADDVAQMSVNEINLLISSKNYVLTDFSSEGTASSEAYITAEEAQAFAFEYSSKNEEEARYIQVAMDYNTGIVTYEVDFYIDSFKYEYEMNATTGELLEWEVEWKNEELLSIELEELEKSQSITGIGEEEAFVIAFEHAGVNASELVFQSTAPACEDGQEFYEVEFYTADYEYEYKIDVMTGEILEYMYNKAAYESNLDN